MKIAILGTRGIPNAHGGFEQFASYLSKGLVELGHLVYVYNSHNHPYQGSEWNGVKIIHQYDPENKIGTAGQFIYDLNCILDSRKQNFDIILQLGYTSSSVWYWLLPKNAYIITNMDGLEWKRSKYSYPVKLFLKLAERLAATQSDFLIADSIGIKNYISEKYQRYSKYIPYGADYFANAYENAVINLDLKPYGYDMLIARFEPENNIEMILEGFSESGAERNFVVVGNYFTEYGQYIRDKFADERIKFLGGIYDITLLNNLRHFSNIYFHGHSVGGTNPSLLEAMASGALICAHDNIFNKAILGEDAYYFTTSDAISELVLSLKKEDEFHKIFSNTNKIKALYNWPLIIETCEEYMREVMGEKRHAAVYLDEDDMDLVDSIKGPVVKAEVF